MNKYEEIGDMLMCKKHNQWWHKDDKPCAACQVEHISKCVNNETTNINKTSCEVEE